MPDEHENENENEVPEFLAHLLGHGMVIGMSSRDDNESDDSDGGDGPTLRVISLGSMLRQMSDADGEETETETETETEAEGDDELAAHAHKIPPELSGTLRRLVTEIASSIAAHEMATAIKKHVTPQVASEVLWCYGDFEGTTEPSLSTAALINLIRVAHISDDHMMGHLAEIGHFYGYMLAVTMLAEKPERGGMDMLRGLAELEKKD
jgi:hypothetical protein